MLHHLKLFAMIVPVFLLLDFLWLGVLMKNFYNHEIGELARRQDGALAPRWGAAFLVYVLIPAGIVLFVRPHFTEPVSLVKALGWGALFGVILYGVYDLTCLSVVEKWSVRMTVVDICWGGVICGVTSLAMGWAEGWLRS